MFPYCGNRLLDMRKAIMNQWQWGHKGSREEDVLHRNPWKGTFLYTRSFPATEFWCTKDHAKAVVFQDSVIGFWIFGTWMCKLHHVCGSVGRIVSTFLITAMSFDRYVAVCHPHHTYLRSRSFVLGVICCELLLAIIIFAISLPRRNTMFEYWRGFLKNNEATKDFFLHQRAHYRSQIKQLNLVELPPKNLELASHADQFVIITCILLPTF